MNLRFLSFTEQGETLAHQLASCLGGEVSRCGKGLRLQDWTKLAFAEAGGLIFVGAAGIAVRAIAPHLRSKVTDPAVVVVDELGQHAIPILSGHLGGGNDLARSIANACGAEPVITTATDLNAAFAVDEWAKRQGCCIQNPKQIKRVSSKILAGKPVRIGSVFPILGTAPPLVELSDCEPFDIRLDLQDGKGDPLQLVPKIAVLGIGCKKGCSLEQIEDCFSAFLQLSKLCKEAIFAVASIDLKSKETGLLDFCQAHGWPFLTYSAEELQTVHGNYSASSFVESVTGVDNVCERSAVLAAGGPLFHKKYTGKGVTMALALTDFTPDWSFLYV